MSFVIDNLQNYCLGTRYGARLRSRLCRRLSISLVRYRHGLEKFLEHHFIPIRRRFNPHDLPTDLLRVQDPFFFRGRRLIFSTGNVDGRGMACSCAVVHRLSKAVSIFFFKLMLCRKSSISKTLMQQRRRGHACAVLPVWCAGHIIVKSVRQVPTLT